ncbi:MAG: phospho-N-acetylmuramoyl-pentapeptide-transferase [Ruminococcaceae bacterium]|nr:phospho-N-acetylmuramoyl-pentapeptide-transferase [Oscillospiraceae bacterium]
MTAESTPYIWLFLGVFLMGLLLERLWLPILKKRRAGQPILEIGPSWHIAKAGTPTMGGVAFMLAAVLSFLLCLPVFLAARSSEEVRRLSFVLLFAVACGGIGFFDDYCKLRNKRNQGLTAWQKYFLQLVASAVFLALIRGYGGVSTAITLPFSGGEIALGGFYAPLALLFLTGMVNALNLTDGLDGLLAGTAAVMGIFFILYGGAVRGVGVLILGAALSFLPYNAHPAKVFMGDTGSLFLGALVAGGGLISAAPMTTLLAGGIYVVEAASVILQVGFFKLSGGKRLLRMAPLHHHFEKCGWSERMIVLLFTVAATAFAVLAYLGG